MPSPSLEPPPTGRAGSAQLEHCGASGFPETRQQYLRAVAAETARMSYPGSMSRGKRPVVRKGTKDLLEDYFTQQFPIEDVWSYAPRIAKSFAQWHSTRTSDIARVIARKVASRNQPKGVAAKFLNTFMYQLMKYEQARALYPMLHLPLDARVFSQLRRIRSQALGSVADLLAKSPYSLNYPSHIKVQNALRALLAELNARPGAEFQVRATIELNLLWT